MNEEAVTEMPAHWEIQSLRRIYDRADIRARENRRMLEKVTTALEAVCAQRGLVSGVAKEARQFMADDLFPYGPPPTGEQLAAFFHIITGEEPA